MPVAVFRNALCNLAGLQECVARVFEQSPTTQRALRRRFAGFCVGAANDIERIAQEMPAQLQQAGKPLGVIRVQVREEYGVDLFYRNAELRQSPGCPPTRVELQRDIATIVADTAVLHQRAGPCETIGRGWATLCASQRNLQAGIFRRGGARREWRQSETSQKTEPSVNNQWPSPAPDSRRRGNRFD